MKPSRFSTNSRVSAYAALLVVAFFSLFSSASAVAATCTVPGPSLAFLYPSSYPSPIFVVYNTEVVALGVQLCGYSGVVNVSFSTNEPAVALYDDGLHGDFRANDGVYGNTWMPTTTGPVTLTATATDNARAPVTGSILGEVRPPRFYGVEKVPFQWVDATAGAVQPAGAAIPIGFEFNYYGAPYSSLGISRQGALTMGRNWDSPSFVQSPSLPDPTAPNNVIAPFWDTGLVIDSGTVYTRLDGSAPNRQFTVSWIDVAYMACGEFDCAASGTASFQVTLYEGTNDIVFRYLDVDFGFPTDGVFIVGVENSNGTQATLHYAYDQFSNAPTSASVSNQIALRFSVNPPTITSFSPTIGSAPGGMVIIDGTNLVGISHITFNGVETRTFQLLGQTRVAAVLPRGATTGPVCVVTKSAGTACGPGIFTVRPTITSISPTYGRPGKITFVRVDGTNFVPDLVGVGGIRTGQNKVTLNGMAAPNVQYVTSELLFFMTPVTATTGKVTVTTPNGSATSKGDFIFTNDCTLLTPITRVLSLGSGGTVPVNDEVKVTFTGYITNADAITANPATGVINVCAGTTLNYTATATKGTLSCTRENRAVDPSGNLSINSNLRFRCSNTSGGGGEDIDAFSLRAQP